MGKGSHTRQPIGSGLSRIVPVLASTTIGSAQAAGRSGRPGRPRHAPGRRRRAVTRTDQRGIGGVPLTVHPACVQTASECRIGAVLSRTITPGSPRRQRGRRIQWHGEDGRTEPLDVGDRGDVEPGRRWPDADAGVDPGRRSAPEPAARSHPSRPMIRIGTAIEATATAATARSPACRSATFGRRISPSRERDAAGRGGCAAGVSDRARDEQPAMTDKREGQPADRVWQVRSRGRTGGSSMTRSGRTRSTGRAPPAAATREREPGQGAEPDRDLGDGDDRPIAAASGWARRTSAPIGGSSGRTLHLRLIDVARSPRRRRSDR
jgi:hypothetical protein